MKPIIKQKTDNINIEPDDVHPLADDIQLAVSCEKKLMDHYPGHIWSVKLDEIYGMLYIVNSNIQCELSTNMLYGYRLKLSTVYGDPLLKCIVKAGGEILERAYMKRGWWNGESPTKIDGVKAKHQPMAGQRVKLI